MILRKSNNRNPFVTNVFFWVVLLLGKIMLHELNPFRAEVRSVILRTLVYINAGYTLCRNGNHQTFMICLTALCFLLWVIGFEKKETFNRTLHAYKTETIYQFPYHWLLYTYHYLTTQDPENSQ